MAASRSEISGWFDEGVKQGATHMVVVCDTFDWEDFPVFVEPTQDCRDVVADFTMKEMHKVMEVYNLQNDKEAQLDQQRAMNP